MTALSSAVPGWHCASISEITGFQASGLAAHHGAFQPGIEGFARGDGLAQCITDADLLKGQQLRRFVHIFGNRADILLSRDFQDGAQ